MAAAFIDRALYLPKAWVRNLERRTEIGAPGEVVFENEVELAKEMLGRGGKRRISSPV